MLAAAIWATRKTREVVGGWLEGGGSGWMVVGSVRKPRRRPGGLAMAGGMDGWDILGSRVRLNI